MNFSSFRKKAAATPVSGSQTPISTGGDSDDRHSDIDGMVPLLADLVLPSEVSPSVTPRSPATGLRAVRHVAVISMFSRAASPSHSPSRTPRNRTDSEKKKVELNEMEAKNWIEKAAKAREAFQAEELERLQKRAMWKSEEESTAKLNRFNSFNERNQVYDIDPKDAPKGDIALIFTDVQDSTILWNKDSKAMQKALSLHNNILRKNIRLHKGYEVKTEGDAFMVAFPSVDLALYCCMSIQIDLLQCTDWPEDILKHPSCDKSQDGLWNGLRVRMGLHCGRCFSEVDPLTGRMDYFGPTVNRTSRIAGLATGGELVISAEARRVLNALAMYDDSLSNYMNIKLDLKSIGKHQLKGFEASKDDEVFSVYPLNLKGRRPVRTLESETVRDKARLSLSKSPDVGIVYALLPQAVELWQELGEDMSEVLVVLRRCIKTTLKEFSGVEVSVVADRHVLAFKGVPRALDFCMKLQNDLIKQNWPDKVLKLAIASPQERSTPLSKEDSTGDAFSKYIWRGPRITLLVHKGDVFATQDEGSSKIEFFYGKGLNDLMSYSTIGKGGETLISYDAYNAVKLSQPIEDMFLIREALLQNSKQYHVKMYRIFQKNLIEREKEFVDIPTFDMAKKFKDQVQNVIAQKKNDSIQELKKKLELSELLLNEVQIQDRKAQLLRTAYFKIANAFIIPFIEKRLKNQKEKGESPRTRHKSRIADNISPRMVKVAIAVDEASTQTNSVSYNDICTQTDAIVPLKDTKINTATSPSPLPYISPSTLPSRNSSYYYPAPQPQQSQSQLQLQLYPSTSSRLNYVPPTNYNLGFSSPPPTTYHPLTNSYPTPEHTKSNNFINTNKVGSSPEFSNTDPVSPHSKERSELPTVEAPPPSPHRQKSQKYFPLRYNYSKFSKSKEPETKTTNEPKLSSFNSSPLIITKDDGLERNLEEKIFSESMNEDVSQVGSQTSRPKSRQVRENSRNMITLTPNKSPSLNVGLGLGSTTKPVSKNRLTMSEDSQLVAFIAELKEPDITITTLTQMGIYTLEGLKLGIQQPKTILKLHNEWGPNSTMKVIQKLSMGSLTLPSLTKLV